LSLDIQEFRRDIIAQSRVEFGDDDSHSGFVVTAGRMLEDVEEIVDFMPCPFRGTGTRRKGLGVDGYAFDEADGSVRVAIATFFGTDGLETVTQTFAKAEFSKLSAFLEEALTGVDDHLPAAEDPATDFARMLVSHQAVITRLRLYLVTDGVLSERIRDWPEGQINGIPTEFHIWDIQRFHGALTSQTGREALEIDFTTLVEGGVPCLQASLDQSSYSGYLCVIPGTALAAMYETYGSRLLEGNVRSFLGKTGKVNKSIRDTILHRPEMFFAFNNGIAATAAAVEVEAAQGGPRLVRAKDLQIVNGGQTTASLAFSTRKDGADLSRIFIQMKLSVVSDAVSGELIPKISEYANKQNKVSDSDLFSNHEYHRKLEELSRRIKAPPQPGSQRVTRWFYERAKGQYRIETAKMSPAEKQRFEADNPKAQVITKTDLAKIENSWRGLPHEVSKGAQKNFDLFSKFVIAAWASKPLQFNEDYFKMVVAHAIVFRALERLIPNEDWYDGGYRANVVTYTVAKLVHMLEDQCPGYSLSCQTIWRHQALSAALAAQLRVIARTMYGVIASPEEGLENVTEWCKKELAWQRAQQQPIAISPDLRAELVSVDNLADAQKDAQDVERIDRGIAAVTTVLQVKPSTWKQIRQWGIQNNYLTVKEEQLLLFAATPGKVPSDRQATAILQIRKKLQQEGLRFE
jgi:hypothetical protein